MNEPISVEDNRQIIEQIKKDNSKRQQDICDVEFLVDSCEKDDLPQPEISYGEYGVSATWRLDWTITISRDSEDDWVDFFAFCSDDEKTIHCKFITNMQAYRLLKLFVLHVCYDE